MGEIQKGMNVDDADHLPKQEVDECDEVVDGIVRSLEAGKEDVQAEAISYFQSLSDEEPDVPGLEVPEKKAEAFIEFKERTKNGESSNHRTGS